MSASYSVVLFPILQYEDIPGEVHEDFELLEEEEEWADGEDGGDEELVAEGGDERTVYVDAEGEGKVELVRCFSKPEGSCRKAKRYLAFGLCVQAAGVEEQIEEPVLNLEEGRPLAEELAEAELLLVEDREVVGEEEKAAVPLESVVVERVRGRGRPKV